jgi:thioredoxin 1
MNVNKTAWPAAILAALALAAPCCAIIDPEWQDLLDPNRYPPPAQAVPPALPAQPTSSFSADSAVIKITSKNIASEVVYSPIPVLLYFYDDAQQASRDVAAGIEEIARQAGGKFKTGRVNVQEEPELLPNAFGKKRPVPQLPVLLLAQGTRAKVMKIVLVADDKGDAQSARIESDGSAPFDTTAWKIGYPPAFEADSPVVKVTKATYEKEVLKSPIPVLVNYYGDWCGHCKEWAPHVEWMATHWAGRLKVVRVNVDEEPELDKAAGVRMLPAFYYVSGGKAQEIEIEVVTNGKGENLYYRFVPPMKR